MQMAGMLVNNTIYYFNISNTFSYGLDFLLGGSFITIFLIYICSYVFEFCEWHRIINTANFINIGIANIDFIFCIPIEDLTLLVIYYIISSIFIIYAAYNHVRKRNGWKAIKHNKTIAARSD